MGAREIHEEIEEAEARLQALKREKRRVEREKVKEMAPRKEAVSPYLDVIGLAEYLGGFATQTIYNWVADKKSGIPYRRIGGRLRFVPAEIDEWVKSKKK